MKIVSAPNYFSFINQIECPFFKKSWSDKCSVLIKNTKWIDALEIEDNEKYSRDIESDDFPTYWNWPQEWQNEFEDAKNKAHSFKKEHLKNAEIHQIDSSTLYILDESEEVWFSTSYYANGEITKMGCNEQYDSALTAAYIFINEYAEWEKKHSATYKMANMLSSADSVFTDSLVNTNNECDGCGSFALIVKEYNDIALCRNCAK